MGRWYAVTYGLFKQRQNLLFTSNISTTVQIVNGLYT